MRSVTFFPAEGGRLELRSDSYLDSLLPLGALLHTRRADHNRLQTDLEGLRTAYNTAEDAKHGIADLLEIIGCLAAHIDAKEIPEHVWNAVGWNLVGLAGLLRDVEEVSSIAAGQLRPANTPTPEAKADAPDSTADTLPRHRCGTAVLQSTGGGEFG